MASTQRFGLTRYVNTPAGVVAGILAGLVALWYVRSRQRSALGNLDDRLLRDVGIGRIDADNEARKWFWQA